MKRVRIGLLLLAMAGMVASLMVYQSEKISRHENDWRNAIDRNFPKDFKK